MILKENVGFLINLQNDILTQETNNPDKSTIDDVTENKKHMTHPGRDDNYCVKFDEKNILFQRLTKIKRKTQKRILTQQTHQSQNCSIISMAVV